MLTPSFFYFPKNIQKKKIENRSKERYFANFIISNKQFFILCSALPTYMGRSMVYRSYSDNKIRSKYFFRILQSEKIEGKLFSGQIIQKSQELFRIRQGACEERRVGEVIACILSQQQVNIFVQIRRCTLANMNL